MLGGSFLLRGLVPGRLRSVVVLGGTLPHVVLALERHGPRMPVLVRAAERGTVLGVVSDFNLLALLTAPESGEPD